MGCEPAAFRAALSGLGIAIGIGAMVAVVGVSSSAQANLLAEIDALGTNLLTVTPGQTFLGANETLPSTAVPMIGHMLNVDRDAAVYQVSGVSVYRTQYVPVAETGGIGVDAAGDDLPQVVGTSMSSGHFLDARRGGFPEAVLGAQAAEVLDITRVDGHLSGSRGPRNTHLAERSCDVSSTSEVRSSRSIRDAFAWSSVGGVS